MTHYLNNLDRHAVLFTSQERGSRLATIARLSFVAYLFFIFFGTSLPFRAAITDVDEIATSSRFNQVIFSFLFLTSFFTLIPKRQAVYFLIKKEKFFSLFLIWCLLSALWSDFSFVSFKRVFQIFTTVTVSLAVLLYTSSSNESLRFFKSILYLYIFLSILSVFFVPGAIDSSTLTWRGLAPSKNHLGQASLISVLVWLNALHLSGTAKERLLSVLMMMLSMILLIGSKSMTSVLTLFLITLIWSLFALDNRFQLLGIGRLFSVSAIFIFLVLCVLIFYLAPELIASIPGYLGKDITFTGRTVLWSDIVDEARRHLLFGCGFGGFWVFDNINLVILYEDYVWLPRQAHMGYLDILNETGLVGLGLFLAMVVAFFINLLNLGKPFFWKWFLIAALIINFQETTLFRPNIMTGVMFIFSYLALYVELIKHDRPHNFKWQSNPVSPR